MMNNMHAETDAEALTGDPCLTLWQSARDSAEAAEPVTLARAAGCLAVALAEMVVSARVRRHRVAAEALAGAPGTSTVSGVSARAGITGAVTANAYLMHARLTDDSYRVAAHPGLSVVPVALAATEYLRPSNAQPIDGTRLLRAVVGGYECACQLAERLLPEVSRRGWRVTSVIAPLAAATTFALAKDMSDDDASAALGLAAAATGGPLGVVSADGDGWRLQPALAVQAGVSAAIAASAGLKGGSGALAGPHGLYSLFGNVDAPQEPMSFPEPAVHRVTFKRYPVAMYGQSIFDAIRQAAPISGRIERITVQLAPFAAGYGNQRDASVDSISSVEGITLAAMRSFHPDLAIGDGTSQPRVHVLGDPALPELTAHVRLGLSDGRQVTLTGDGDTSGWEPAGFHRHCVELLGDAGGQLCQAAVALPDKDGIDLLLNLWRAAR